MEKLKDEQNETTKKPDVYTLPTLDARRGWDLVTLPGGDAIIWMVR